MEFELEGIISRELIAKAERGEISPYVVCGVDVYKTPEAAREEDSNIDRQRPCVYAEEMFFSDRHYRIIHLLDETEEEYDPRIDIGDIKNRLKQLKAKRIGFLNRDYLEEDDDEVLYVLTPLTHEEEAELLKK